MGLVVLKLFWRFKHTTYLSREQVLMRDFYTRHLPDIDPIAVDVVDSIIIDPPVRIVQLQSGRLRKQIVVSNYFVLRGLIAKCKRSQWYEHRGDH